MQSGTVDFNTVQRAVQYNNLRADLLSETSGHNHDGNEGSRLGAASFAQGSFLRSQLELRQRAAYFPAIAGRQQFPPDYVIDVPRSKFIHWCVELMPRGPSGVGTASAFTWFVLPSDAEPTTVIWLRVGAALGAGSFRLRQIVREFHGGSQLGQYTFDWQVITQGYYDTFFGFSYTAWSGLVREFIPARPDSFFLWEIQRDLAHSWASSARVYGLAIVYQGR